MNGRGNELGAVIDLIADKVRFLKLYPGEVLDAGDPEARGRVKCSVPELGWFSGDQSPWCDPRYRGGSVVTPEAGTWVSVGFMAGDPARPYYCGALGEVAGQTPEPHNGPAKRVLYSDGQRQVTYDSDADELLIDGFGSVKVNGDSKSFVTHAELDSALQSLVSTLNGQLASIAAGATAAVAAGGFWLTPLTVGGLTLDISAAKTETLKTGG